MPPARGGDRTVLTLFGTPDPHESSRQRIAPYKGFAARLRLAAEMLSVKCLRPPAARSGAGTRLSTNRSVAAHQARADVLLHTGRGTCRCAVQRARFGRCAHRAALYTHRRKQMLRACRCGCDYHLLFKTVMSSPGCGTLEPLRTSEPENLGSFSSEPEPRTS